VQDEGRKLIEELTREIRVTSIEGIDVSRQKCISLSGFRYYWSEPISNQKGAPGRLLREEGKGCADNINSGNPGGVDVLNTRVGVQFMEVSRIAGSGSTFRIKLVLSTAETELIDATGENATCVIDSGNQYCDIVSFVSVVNSR